MKLNLPPVESVDRTAEDTWEEPGPYVDHVVRTRDRQIAEALRWEVERAKHTNITVPDPDDPPNGELWFNPMGVVSQYWHERLLAIADEIDPVLDVKEDPDVE